MENFLIDLMLNPTFSIVTTLLAVTSYMFNVLILRLRKHYLPMNNKIFIVMALFPGINCCFLLLNLLILGMNITGYTFTKKRMTKQTYRYHQQKAAKAKVTPIKAS